MQNLHERLARRKIPEQFEFDWSTARGPEASAPAAPRIVRQIAQRFGLSIPHASTIASLVGIPAEGIS